MTVSGLTIGYQGEEVKNVIPSEASVKINMRLVPDQQPSIIAEQLTSFIQSRFPAGFRYRLTFSSMVNPV
ncbi:MAG: peptidase dimerization domain-containing protein [Williamsia sp.]|nr:peptidase dimerization domain-containing protein [Williamsia sp.]